MSGGTTDADLFPLASPLHSEMELAQKHAQQSCHASAIRLCPIVGLSTYDEEAQKRLRP
jgi:hypothetical protein